MTLGSVVETRLGLGWSVSADPFGVGVEALAGLALRQNPRRAHLIVSRVLGKHLPAAPSEVVTAGRRLGGLVGDVLPDRGAPVVLGYCETATALGHLVADALPDSLYVHTTRRPDPDLPVLLGFDEEHSHATAHHVQTTRDLFGHSGSLVLVDDELTTGTTALNTIAAVAASHPRDRYVVAVLLDTRDEAARAAFGKRVADLGVEVEVVALLDAVLRLPADVLARAAPWQEELSAAVPPAATGTPAAAVVRPGLWDPAVRTGGRHGFGPEDRPGFERALAGLAAALRPGLAGRVLVLGTEELMYLPIRLAHLLEKAGLSRVSVQSTTRSPVLPLAEEGYAIRHRLDFPAPDDAGRPSFLYNVDHPSWEVGGGRYDHVVVVAEDPVAACAPLAEALRPWASAAVHLVPVGAG